MMLGTGAFTQLFNGEQSLKADAQKRRSFWENFGRHLPSLPQGGVDFASGFGDMASFGLSEYIRELYGIDGGINYGSSEYNAGLYSGVVGSIGTIAAGGMAFNVGLRSVGGANQLYHFTTAANAAGISSSGVIHGSSGLRALYGQGVYTSAFRSAGYARVQGAVSTEAMITINSRALATPFPGTFRFPGSVKLR
ncbi:MAG: hypothetical protein AAGB12_04725 [Pseudomonadota bacterium]